MLFISFHEITIKNLKILSKNKIKKYYKYRKKPLYNLLYKFYAAKKIQTTWRNIKRDPITLSIIRQPIYIYKHSNGCSTIYNLTSLVDYILYTNNYKEPTSGSLFTNSQLKEMDNLCKKHNLCKKSVYKTKKNPLLETQKRNHNQHELYCIQNRIDIYVEDVFNIIEDDPFINNRTLHIIRLYLFPQIAIEYLKYKKIEPQCEYILTNIMEKLYNITSNSPQRLNYLIQYINDIFIPYPEYVSKLLRMLS